MFWEGKPLAPGCLGKQHGLQQGLRQYPANDRCPSETSSIPVKSMMEYSTSIPGSFLLDHSLPPKLDVNVGATSHFFQPPRTPSASTSLHRSSISISSGFRNESTNKGCKRGRDDSFKSSATVTPMAVVERSLSTSVRPATPSTPGTLSPAPLVNTRYQLAGGLDTPTPTQDSYTLSPISQLETVADGRAAAISVQIRASKYPESGTAKQGYQQHRQIPCGGLFMASLGLLARRGTSAAGPLFGAFSLEEAKVTMFLRHQIIPCMRCNLHGSKYRRIAYLHVRRKKRKAPYPVASRMKTSSPITFPVLRNNHRLPQDPPNASSKAAITASFAQTGSSSEVVSNHRVKVAQAG